MFNFINIHAAKINKRAKNLTMAYFIMKTIDTLSFFILKPTCLKKRFCQTADQNQCNLIEESQLANLKELSQRIE